MPVLNVPLATYRLQFNGGFRFSDARALLPYFEQLGISDVYTSPLLKCQRDSSHGYDVCDHARFNPALGTPADLDELTHELAAHGMGMIVDVVPNHMGILDPANRWWHDVLENGPSSPYAHFFDIDWDPPKEDLREKVLLPLLGDQFGKVLENGEIRVLYDEGAFVVAYYEHRFPVSPGTWQAVLEPALHELRAWLDEDDPSVLELESIVTALEHLPSRSETDPDKVRERQREKEVAKRRLAELVEENQSVAAAIQSEVARINGNPGDPRSFDRLEALLDEQAYRLCFWRVAAEEINYRRFFDVNDLAAIRVEEPEVFEEVHGLILRLIREGCVTGLRIDHPDGLFDPEQYFLDLQRACLSAVDESLRLRRGASAGRRAGASRAMVSAAAAPVRASNGPVAGRGRTCSGRMAPSAGPTPEHRSLIKSGGWDLAETPGAVDATADSEPAPFFQQQERSFYVVVEKILEPGERLPLNWAVHGTTGYEFLNSLNGIFVDPAGERAFRNLYGRFTGVTTRFSDLVYESKKLILDASMSSELHVLARRLDRISEQHRWSRDFTLWSLQEALAEVIACFPVYRTYVRPQTDVVSEADRRHIVWAVRAATRRNPSINESVFQFIENVLLLQLPEGLDAAQCRDFVMRFQQITAPVMAKGLEDTAFYRSYWLASLNEVGGQPSQWSVSVDQFHHANRRRCAQWPLGLSCTATHDTKRGEDVRARINVLSEVPEVWGTHLRRWRNLNRRKKQNIEGVAVPDANEEYLLYQTLLGVWPLAAAELPDLSRRLAEYMTKAARERKVHTSWISPNEQHERAVVDFVEALFASPETSAFFEDFLPFQRWVAFYGAINALSQVLVKITAPGVPDFYQGTELWDFSLVDPDNRRPVDFAIRAKMLGDLLQRAGNGLAPLAEELVADWTDGRVKLFLIWRALSFRRDQRELFLCGDYVPLRAVGARSGQVCAFARSDGSDWSITAVPRWLAQMAVGREPVLEPSLWATTQLHLPPEAPAEWYHVLTGQQISATADAQGTRQLPLAEAFQHFPVGLLAPVGDCG